MIHRPTREDFRLFVDLAHEIANEPTDRERAEQLDREARRERLLEVLRWIATAIAGGICLAAVLTWVFGE